MEPKLQSGFIEWSQSSSSSPSSMNHSNLRFKVATKGNYITIVEKLLEKSPNINTVDKDGMTALSIACKEGYQDIAFMLLNAGAYTNLQDRSGDTNLIYACKYLPVWPEVGVKISPNVCKSYPRSSHSSFYIRGSIQWSTLYALKHSLSLNNSAHSAICRPCL